MEDRSNIKHSAKIEIQILKANNGLLQRFTNW